MDSALFGTLKKDNFVYDGLAFVVHLEKDFSIKNLGRFELRLRR